MESTVATHKHASLRRPERQQQPVLFNQLGREAGEQPVSVDGAYGRDAAAVCSGGLWSPDVTVCVCVCVAVRLK